jgi:hypothetical protein
VCIYIYIYIKLPHEALLLPTLEEIFERREFLSRGSLVLFRLIPLGMAPRYTGILEKPLPEEE